MAGRPLSRIIPSPLDARGWKEELSGEQKREAFAKSYDASLLAIPEINKNLQAIDGLSFSEEH